MKDNIMKFSDGLFRKVFDEIAQEYSDILNENWISAPRRAGQNVASPSGLLLVAIQMLDHIGQPEAATRIHNAWLTTTRVSNPFGK